MLSLKADLKAMQGQLEAYYTNPTIEAALQVTAAADKVSAKLELTAVTTISSSEASLPLDQNLT